MRTFVVFAVALIGFCPTRPAQGQFTDQLPLRRLPPIGSINDHSTAGPVIQSQYTTPAADPVVPATVPPSTEVEEIADDHVWYTWITPTYWALAAPWETSFEMGMDGTNGNTETFTLRGGVELKRKVDWSDLRVDMSYTRGSADSIETKHDAQLSVNHDWLLGDSPWSIFGKMQLEYDEFKAFNVRLVLNSGVGYKIIGNDITTVKGRVGAGTSREFGGPDDSWVPEAVLGLEFEHKLTDRQKLRATVEYFPAWDNFKDYRLRTDAGWEVLLDEATNMSLKLGILDRYDSTPNGRRPNDFDYSLLLLWKL